VVDDRVLADEAVAGAGAAGGEDAGPRGAGLVADVRWAELFEPPVCLGELSFVTVGDVGLCLA
jgi:hypothetical protein